MRRGVGIFLIIVTSSPAFAQALEALVAEALDARTEHTAVKSLGTRKIGDAQHYVIEAQDAKRNMSIYQGNLLKHPPPVLVGATAA